MSKVTSEEKIAVIGMGCRFPGGASSPEKYWDLLQNGRDAITDVPEDRWDVKKYYGPDPEKPGKVNVMRGGFLQEPFNEFVAQFFGISSREAAILDPQQRLLLEVAWEALEDAGLIASDLRGSRTGVYIGSFTLDNQNQQFHPFNRNIITTHTATSSSMTMLSNRLSYTFDFRGHSISVDTACSSSLTALHLACQGFLNNESDLAVSGGANVLMRPEYFITICKGGFLSPDGLCNTFDASANAYVRGEGAGIIVLKRLSDTLRDGDSIHVLIVASSINQDGHTQGITLPSVQSQQELIQEVLGKANLASSQIQYIEAHGTGTQAGDPIEAQSLGTILGQGRADDDYCFIGSVKTIIGHLESAAGVAGFMKVVLVMKHQAIPPHLHVQTPNPAIDFAAIRLRIPRQLESWTQEPPYAAVNSFGYSGTNAHVIIEEAPASPHTHVPSSKRVSILPISAASNGALRQRARQVAEMIANGQPISDVAYTLARPHDHLPHRLAAVAHDTPSFRQAIGAFVKECLQEAGSEGVTFLSLKRKQPEIGSLLLTVADVYTHGIGINWQRAYPQGNRVKLPTYRWEKETLWAETEEARADRVGDKYEHPLIERVPGVPDPTWQGELSTFHHPYLSDHQIQEMLIFPAACYVELGLAIARKYGSTTLEDINLQRAIVVDKSPMIQLKLDSSSGTFTVYSRPLDRQSDWTVNASGRIVGSSIPHDAVDLERWKAQCTIEQDVNTLYAHLNSRGMHYGAHFRSIQQIWTGEHEVLARIAPAPETLLNGYLIHPTILDAGFQSLIALLQNDESHEAYAPVSIDRVCLYQPGEKDLWCYAQLKRRGKRKVVGDLLFCDDAGNVVIAIRGLHLKSPGPTTSLQENFYEMQWQEAKMPIVSASAGLRNWLLFIDWTGVGDALLNTCGQHQFIRVRAGDRFERFSDGLFQLALKIQTISCGFWITLERSKVRCSCVGLIWRTRRRGRIAKFRQACENALPGEQILTPMESSTTIDCLKNRSGSSARAFGSCQFTKAVSGYVRHISTEACPIRNEVDTTGALC